MVGNSPRVRWELVKGIRSLPRWRKRVHRKKTETRRKIVGGSRKAYRELRSGGCITVTQVFEWLTIVEPPRTMVKSLVLWFRGSFWRFDYRC
ncbi:hypothetical protein B296_00023606 [Ensete ventricosum]|uniref:Uncharacterized protein n=1 Tax=Ensete ventricosum TaxID=4639 RepID=A0A427ANN1_ENSVE|nr:hypothetical protein B296_00023606 [Ensete ventricosum]